MNEQMRVTRVSPSFGSRYLVAFSPEAHTDTFPRETRTNIRDFKKADVFYAISDASIVLETRGDAAPTWLKCAL